MTATSVSDSTSSGSAQAGLSPTALAGVRVIDLSRVLAGPWSTQILADLGADVIKIERPGAGDDTRGWGPPFLKDDAGHESAEAAYYLSANRNKRSVTCDIAQPAGQALIRELVRDAQVFVENFKVGDMARYGLDYASLQAINPRLVYCSITGFGQTGPYRERPGYDYAIQGIGGLMSITGERDDRGGGPQKVGVAVADLFTGMYSTVGILAALRHAERTGEGQHVDMALLDVQVAVLANQSASYLISGNTPSRAGNAHQTVVPYQVFEVMPPPDSAPGAHDYMILAVGNDGQFAKMCAVAGCPELAADERFARNQDRVRNRDALIGRLEAVFLTRTKADWLASLEAAKVPCGPINNLAEVFADPHVRSRAMVQTWTHPLNHALPLGASPLKLAASPVRGPANGGLPPPLLGQHTEEVLRSLPGYDSSRIDELRRAGVI